MQSFIVNRKAIEYEETMIGDNMHHIMFIMTVQVQEVGCKILCRGSLGIPTFNFHSVIFKCLVMSLWSRSLSKFKYKNKDVTALTRSIKSSFIGSS